MKIIKRFFFLVSLFFIYIILKEFLILYHYARSLHPILGYAFLACILAGIVYFIGIPIFRIVAMPKAYSPTKDPDKISVILQSRIRNFQRNPFLLQTNFDFSSITADKADYQKIIDFIQPEMEKIRKKYVTQVFYLTSIAQNGFLDAVLILSSSVHLIKELFILYHGRVSNRDLISIAKKVYYSMAIGGSEGVEYATDEIISKIFAGGVKGIPFASKILGSVADGFVNAALLTRISLITENYCKLLFIESDRALYPSYRTIISATRIITSDLIDKVLNEVKNLAKDKTGQVVLMTVNPVGYVVGKAIGRYADESDKLTPKKREMIKEVSLIAHNPLGYILRRIGRKNSDETIWDE